MHSNLNKKGLKAGAGTFSALVLLVVVDFLLIPSAALAGIITPESGGSAGADNVNSLYKLVLYIAIAVFVLVEGALFYAIVRYRHRRNAKAAQIVGNSTLEMGWTVAAALILVVLAVATFVKLDSIKEPPGGGLPGPRSLAGAAAAPAASGPQAEDRIQIDVSGQQYLWRYTYPDGSFSFQELVVPVGKVIILKITATDVAHSFWVPELGGKKDALPGYEQYMWFKATEPGTYRGQCAELCGIDHATMSAKVRFVPQEEYESFLTKNKEDIQRASEELKRLKPQFES